MAEPEKRRWTDPVVLVPIIGAVIAAIVGPVVVSMIQQSPDEPVPAPITPVPIPESSDRILQPNLSQYIGQWYYTSFYNTHTAEQAPINKIILSEDSEGLVQVDFFGPNLMHSVGAEEQRVRLLNRDPDNLLVSWIPGGRIYCEDSGQPAS
jgi:hypothetical protein